MPRRRHSGDHKKRAMGRMPKRQKRTATDQSKRRLPCNGCIKPRRRASWSFTFLNRTRMNGPRRLSSFLAGGGLVGVRNSFFRIANTSPGAGCSRLRRNTASRASTARRLTSAWKMANPRFAGCGRTRMNSISTPTASHPAAGPPAGMSARVQARCPAWMRMVRTRPSRPGPMRWCCLTRSSTWLRWNAWRPGSSRPGKFRRFTMFVPTCRPRLFFTARRIPPCLLNRPNASQQPCAMRAMSARCARTKAGGMAFSIMAAAMARITIRRSRRWMSFWCNADF